MGYGQPKVLALPTGRLAVRVCEPAFLQVAFRPTLPGVGAAIPIQRRLSLLNRGWTRHFSRFFRVLGECKIWKKLHAALRSVPMGFVHVRGKAKSEQVLFSPVSHRLCCFYKVEIDQWRSSGKSHSWQRCCWLPFPSGGRDWDDSDSRARSGVRPPRELNPRGQFLPGDSYLGAGGGEWGHQRMVICCDM
jgi:hypothetical protein